MKTKVSTAAEALPATRTTSGMRFKVKAPVNGKKKYLPSTNNFLANKSKAKKNIDF